MSSSLLKRIISGLILAPCFVFIMKVGGITLLTLLGVAFIISLYEWFFLSKKIKYFVIVMLLGVVYMGASYLSFYVLRQVYSVNVLLLFIGMIWLSDIGAYFVGKYFGGPKLIPQISPNKTWSGFGGALISPALFGVLWVLIFGFHPEFNDSQWYVLFPIIALLGVIIGAVGQAGDLLISFVKRKADVKDTGALIPGHGGLLDRIDSMLLGAPVYLALIALLFYAL